MGTPSALKAIVSLLSRQSFSNQKLSLPAGDAQSKGVVTSGRRTGEPVFMIAETTISRQYNSHGNWMELPDRERWTTY
jgi:hypothetical protein